jgi:hypothetical protein
MGTMSEKRVEEALHDEVDDLRARLRDTSDALNETRNQLYEIYSLHTDSPAGVCPSCYRLHDALDTDDGLVDWPCPTLRAMGVGPDGRMPKEWRP